MDMKKNAVIDVGSNSVRLMFVADGKILYKDLQITRLGEGLAGSGILSEAAIERSASAVTSFYRRARAEGADKVCAFATAAVRSAKNGDEFVRRVRSLCGLSVDVISGEEEAEIGILGAIGNADGGIIDVGGASTEIIVRDHGSIVYKKSVDVGVVRLKDLCGRNADTLAFYTGNAVVQFGDVPAKALYAIGGTATSLASIVLKQKIYDGKAVTGLTVDRAQLCSAVEYLKAASIERITQETCVPEKRAEVLLGGAIWLYTIFDRLGLERLIVSDADNLEGYAKKHGLL